MAGEHIFAIVCFVTGEKYLTIYCRKRYKQLLVKRHRRPTQTMYYLETSVPQIYLAAEIFLLLKSVPPHVI